LFNAILHVVDNPENVMKRARCRDLQIALAAVITSCLATTPMARADEIIQYTLENVVFNDGTTASGYFSFDETQNEVVSAWDITYTGGGSDGVPSDVFSSSGGGTIDNSGLSGTPPAVVFYSDDAGSELLDLYFGAPLDDATDTLNTGDTLISYYEGDEAKLPSSSDASVDPTAVTSIPEPASLAILGTTLASLGFLRRRKKVA